MVDITSLQPTISLAPGETNTAITGTPTGSGGKANMSPEFRDRSLLRTIEARGSRVAWARASLCPCRLNAYTEQPSPRCTRCRGTGQFYFGVRDYNVPTAAGEINSIQQTILADDSSSVIRGVFSQVKEQDQPYTERGYWAAGTMYISVRPENRIGYYDRLVNLDAVMSFSEILDLTTATSDITRLRYRAVGLNQVATVDTTYLIGTDVSLRSDGQIEWATGLRPAERVSIHYLMHPTWLVVDHPHAFRVTQRLRKVASPKTPLGEPTDLPMQARVRLEFLIPELRTEG